MSVAVNLKGGPFSQIGLEIVSLTTAYQLATGVYGWYKAKQRSQSLIELVSVSGGELVPTSSFNFNMYRNIRTHRSMIQDVVVQGQEVQRTALPKASTAIPDHPGTACLRALTAGLLCLFAHAVTVEVLKNLIPFALIQLHQEDTSIEFESGLLTSLNHWVSAIMVEEDSDVFRDYMHNEVRSRQSKLTGLPFNEIMSLEYSIGNEIPYVIGVLRWILTPRHKRQTKQYPTRLLKAWTIALIMENLKGGPFSQIGLEIVSLTTAYQLATGVYGWYKAKQRSQSLIELVSVSGGELVPTSSFNFNMYRNIRTHRSMIQDVVVQGQEVQRTALPKASTAIPDHPGTACLRALTAGLLCLFAHAVTVEVLKNLIPFALIQLHQEDTSIEFESGLLTSLNHWVSAIMVEEDSDVFRDYMHNEVRSRQSKLTGLPFNEIMSLEYSIGNEIPYVIGVLRWILTPRHKRQTKQYPTRLLKAWTIALIMENLGFEVHAESVVRSRYGSHGTQMHDSPRSKESPHVFLAIGNDADTDPMPLVHVPSADDSPRPLITMIRGIPWIAFRHLRGSSIIDTQFLADVWKLSFKSGKAQFRGITMNNQNIHIETAATSLEEVTEHHKNLLSEFHPNLGSICGPSLRHFVPMSSHSPGWALAELKEQMRILKTPDELADPGCPCRGNCYVLYAIVCGAMYGLCSSACFDNGNVLSEDSEVAFIPDLFYESGGARLKRWAQVVGGSLMMGHQISLCQWIDLLFEMFLGKDTQSGARTNTVGNDYIRSQNPFVERLLLGAQGNGLAAVSDMLVNTSAQVESFLYIHIQRGQVLSFPLTEDQFIEASSYVDRPSTLELDPDPQNDRLCRFDGESFNSTMRVDVEPCWEDDPRKVSFVVRLQGIPIASLNIWAFLDVMTYKRSMCVCSNPQGEVRVPLSERWQHVSLYQLQRRTFKGMSFRRADVSYADNRVLIDGSQSIAATIYAACTLHVKTLLVASGCLLCAHRHVMLNAGQAGVAILIPYSGDF